MLNPLRFQETETRLAAARVAIAELTAHARYQSSAVQALAHAKSGVDEAGRLFHEAHLLFIKIENLLAIAEWHIERGRYR